jgi:hypothetical protein
MFGAETLDTLPHAPNPRGASSIRKSVISWVCGNGPPRKTRTKAKRRVSAKAKAVSKPKARKPKPADD